MDLEEILNDVKAIDECIEALQEQRLAVLRNDPDYAAYLDRATNGKLTIVEFHVTLGKLQTLRSDLEGSLKHSRKAHELKKEIAIYEEKLGL